MRVINSIAVFLVALLLLGCKPTSTGLSRFDVLSLERMGCEGDCPIYKVTIYGDGKIEYDGKQYARIKGKATSSLTRDQIQELVKIIADVDFFSLRDQYHVEADGCPTHLTDAQSAKTTLEVGGRRKTIDHYYGCMEKGTENKPGEVYPRGLTNFEKRIDEIVNTAQWRGSPDKR
ncbi:MAG TPA: DUF6438 domain-containing protein [Blastocatellia bacterium]|nr:DUF6438 domain-containing protein [Blastocatellia bacterium]